MKRLDVRIVRKPYPGAPRPALESLTLATGAGEIVGIVGPSGCGKSTLLNIVAGLDRAFEGAVEVDGRPAHGAPDGRDGLAPVRIGMMFQASRLMPWLTVLDNLRLVLAGMRTRHRARPPAPAGRRARRRRGRISGPAVGRACSAAWRWPARSLCEPELLLLDEPLVSLDAPTAARLRRHLIELWQGTRPAVLYVTHELREALAVADRVRVPLARTWACRAGAAGRAGPRPREPGDAAVGELHDRLLGRHPELLAGSADHRVTMRGPVGRRRRAGS